jgi:uncharacterized membrane protein YbaN (DUF454 family)
MTATSASSPQHNVKPLPAIVRWVLIGAGTIFVGLGIIGAVVPGLPTTPFVLLAGVCYARSSERMYRWLRSHRTLGPHVSTFVEERAISKRVKWTALAMGWTFIGAAALFAVESAHWKAFLLLLGVVKTLVILRVKTAPAGT